MKLNSENLNINLRHLRSLRAICQTGSFSRAAAELGVVPSALTETIRQLEEAIGAPLFDRAMRPPAPTPLGLDLLEKLDPHLDGIDLAITTIRTYAAMGIGSLAVGASPSAISGLVGPALVRFRTAFPNVRCRLHDDIAEKLADLVIDGKLDIAVAGRALETPELLQSKLMQDRFGLACGANHPFADRVSIRLDELDPIEMISLDAKTGIQQLLVGCRDIPEGLLTGPVQAHSTVAQLCMVRAGFGVALLPENAVGLFGDPSIRFLAIEDLELWRSLYVLEPARRARSHIALAFKKELVPEMP